ncbi:MAG: alkane 1-monooxygenase [Pseudomonadota bacterium]
MTYWMAVYHATLQTGETIEYRDSKRYWWLQSVLYPLQAFVGIALHAVTGNEWWLAFPVLLNYLVAPALDWVIGEDRANPPDEIVSQLEQDRYYRYLTFAVLPMHYIAFIGCAAYIGTQELSWGGILATTIVAGMSAGLAINTGHELGHKNSRLEKQLAKFSLAVAGYGHFTQDHNRSHHRWVATPEDTSSSQMGESIYKFARREIPGSILQAWRIESERLRSRGRSVLHPNNQILQSYAISVAMYIALLAAFGWIMVPYIVLHNLVAYWQLTSANYVEHYGLLRSRDDNGRYERCQPHHSWNCNYRFSNLILFHLQRHSDHHTHPTRRFQSLKHYEDLPTLPNGYMGMYVLAYFPPLWFRVMNPRLLALPHVNGDLDRLNIDPDARGTLVLQYGRDGLREPTIGNLADTDPDATV